MYLCQLDPLYTWTSTSLIRPIRHLDFQVTNHAITTSSIHYIVGRVWWTKLPLCPVVFLIFCVKIYLIFSLTLSCGHPKVLCLTPLTVDRDTLKSQQPLWIPWTVGLWFPATTCTICTIELFWVNNPKFQSTTSYMVRWSPQSCE